jgi:tetratricopeptide (TPR) repeat protein
MQKKQMGLAAIGLLVVLTLYWFGRTEKKSESALPSLPATSSKPFDIQSVKDSLIAALPATDKQWYDSLQTSISNKSSQSEQASLALEMINRLQKTPKADPLLTAYWASEAIKLDNSQKNLTFASQLMLTLLRSEHDDSRLDWLTSQAISSFEQAIANDSTNEDLKIGLGSCYLFGRGRHGDPQETMKGIQQLLSVVRRDSTNMKAQLMLGIGGLISGQNDKAIARLNKVVQQQPDNIEAVAFLADAYTAVGDNTQAIRWYEVSKRLVNNPEYSREVDERIKQLNQNRKP